jgi:4-aminobutyrate aminotransferase-like enzyme
MDTISNTWRVYMRELNVNEITAVNGGNPVVVALGLWTILITGKDQLEEIGKEIGAGIYDGLNEEG